jgi:hypothetical protein
MLSNVICIVLSPSKDLSTLGHILFQRPGAGLALFPFECQYTPGAKKLQVVNCKHLVNKRRGFQDFEAIVSDFLRKKTLEIQLTIW